MQIAVVGLGKIGLPLAVQYSSKGHSVIGVDVNSETVRAVNRGLEPFPGEKDLAERLSNEVASGRLEATTDYAEGIARSDVIVVVVPLFVNEAEKPDFTLLDSATECIGPYLQKGSLVIYETTLPIGTTRGRWRPRLEESSGLLEGVDFHLVFSPERVLTGRVFEDLRKYPKLIGALSEIGSAKAKRFYEAVLDFDIRKDLTRPNGVWDLGNPEAAEMAKLAETTYRDVNIALANQFALHADELGIDVYRVIEACNSQPYSHIHQPGISVGGHCIPVYPRLYLSTDPRRGVVGAARDLNQEMPRAMVKRLLKFFCSLEGVEVLVLGITYRTGVKESAFSGAFSLDSELKGYGAKVNFLDPYYSDQEIQLMGLSPYDCKSKVRAIVLHTSHEEFLNFSRREFQSVEAVIDGRQALDPANWEGAEFISLGK
jgi:UDP-N-acetyl-D-glucosamine dehydrogenase